MNNRLFLLTRLLILTVFVSAFIVLPLEDGKFKATFILQDGERITTDSLFTKFNENDLEVQLPQLKSQNAVLRSYDTDSNDINDFQVYVNYLIKEKIIDYWDIEPVAVTHAFYAFTTEEGGGSYNFKKSNGFEKYYRSLFQSKIVRTILFKSALEYVTVLCKKYPTDFKQRVLFELERQLKFTNKLKFLSYNVDASFDNYWEGFIYRRHFTDNIPILEIQTNIIEAINKLTQTEIIHKIDALYEININNQIALYYSGKSSFIKSISNQKKVYFDKNNNIKSIRYLKDITGDYYQITFMVNDVEKRILYNTNLEKIN